LCYNQIIDVTDDPTVEIRIPYLQARAWSLVDFSANEFFGPTAAAAPAATFTNGRLTIRVLTALTAPAVTANAFIIVSVRAAENMMFSAPTELPSWKHYVTPKVGFAALPSIDEDEFKEDLPELQSQEIAMVNKLPSAFYDPVEDDKRTHLVYMGETMKSLRQLLRRTSLSRTVAVADDSASLGSMTASRHARLPLFPGWDPSGINYAVNGATPSIRYNFVNQIPFTWLSNCYVGNRGSIIWHYNIDSANAVSLRSDRAQRTLTLAAYQSVNTVLTAEGNSQRVADLTYGWGGAGSSGMSIMNQHTQTGLSVSAPMYSMYRMLNNNPDVRNFGSADDGTTDDCVTVYSYTKPVLQNSGTTFINMYTSIGTDFSFLFFLNVPSMYTYATPSASVPP